MVKIQKKRNIGKWGNQCIYNLPNVFLGKQTLWAISGRIVYGWANSLRFKRYRKAKQNKLGKQLCLYTAIAKHYLWIWSVEMYACKAGEKNTRTYKQAITYFQGCREMWARLLIFGRVSNGTSKILERIVWTVNMAFLFCFPATRYYTKLLLARIF